MKLVIGNKNYSSWSLRPWLLMHAHSVDFYEIHESLNPENLRERLGRYSESCKVPVLIDGELRIWDSLAICEYLSESYLNGAGWPTETAYKAQARSISSEMHSGFNALRETCPMNCRMTKTLSLTKAVERDIERIQAIWSNYALPDTHGDLRLFGTFNISDCFFAPVVLRFKTYDVPLSGKAAEYYASMLEHPSLTEWLNMADQESEIISSGEV